MGNEARYCLHCVLVIKLLIMGLLKCMCLYKGHEFSYWHSGFTAVSLLYEVIAPCIRHDDPLAFHGGGAFFKILATGSIFLKDINEMKEMCAMCLVVEIILMVLVGCCYCCIDEPKHNESKMKMSA